MTTLRALIAAALVVLSFGWAVAKLPPPDEKAKAAAEEKKAKDAVTAEADKQALAKAQDRVVAHYMAEQKAKGKTVTPQMGSTSTAPQAPKGGDGDAKMKNGKARK
jgi:membrane protein involved in colicin uptake